ncbi:hypothetical protein NQZ79_g171 [Umbelopsis isabellina]|nr:hypothetical protein NQZ79_g171 [Umbelopsis isabellina]
MQIKAASALFLLFCGYLPGAFSAPAASKKATTSKAATKVLTATVPSRTSLPSSPAPYDSSAESSAVQKNGPLPSNVATKGGFGLNATTGPPASAQKASPMQLNASYGPTSATVKNLEFYTTLAANAYCSAVQSDSWTCAHCNSVPDGKLIISFTTPKTDNVGYILQSDSKKTVYIVFRGKYFNEFVERGTNSLQSFVDDLQFTYTDYIPVSGAKVHNGFYATFNEAAGFVTSNASALLTANPTYDFYVVGHSLGGALAILQALDLYQKDVRFTPSNLAVYTFGEPRVGNPTFAQYATGTGLTIDRTVNQRDSNYQFPRFHCQTLSDFLILFSIISSLSVVPHLPPESFGFLHEGDEFWITDSSSDVYECDDTTLDSSSCSDSIVPFTSLLDHLSSWDWMQARNSNALPDTVLYNVMSINLPKDTPVSPDEALDNLPAL